MLINFIFFLIKPLSNQKIKKGEHITDYALPFFYTPIVCFFSLLHNPQ